MSISISVTQSMVCAALISFIAGIVPTGTPIIRGIQNRSPMPLPNAFVLIQPTGQERLATSVNTYSSASGATTSTVTQSIDLPFQIDCYGPAAFDWAAMISTLFRDDYGYNVLAPVCAPLYCDSARQMPLVAGEEQWIDRWSLDAHIEYDPVTTIPQQYANALELQFISVTEAYPST